MWYVSPEIWPSSHLTTIPLQYLSGEWILRVSGAGNRAGVVGTHLSSSLVLHDQCSSMARTFISTTKLCWGEIGSAMFSVYMKDASWTHVYAGFPH